MTLTLPVATLVVACAGAPTVITGSGSAVPVTKPVVAGESQSETMPVETTTPRGGMRVYKDPVTGKYVEPPAEAAPVPAPEQIVEPDTTRRAPELKVIQAPTPEGGTMLQLKGTFRSYSTATKDEEGKIQVHCNQKMPQDAPVEKP